MALHRLSAANGWYERQSKLFRRGAVLMLALLLVIGVLAFKNQILLVTRGGEVITVQFAQDYNLKPGKSKVKLAGVEVGVVHSVDSHKDGETPVKLKVDESALEILGSEPTAAIEPLTLLGGEYSVNLAPGGAGTYDKEDIPVARSSTPVELDRVLETLPSDTRQSLRGMVDHAEETLSEGGARALQDLTESAPRTLEPAARVLDAVRGERRESDLPALVRDLGAIGQVLSERDEALGSAIDDLDVTTATLAKRSKPVADTVAALPPALSSTRTAMVDLQGTLDKITDTADDIRPGLRELDGLLQALDPAIDQLDPLLADAGPLIEDAVPAVEQLPSVVRQADTDVSHLQGPVLDRVRGPILDTLGSTWRGKDEYRYSGGGLQADNKMYEELAYMVTNIARVSQPHDAQGAMLNFQASVGVSSLAPLTLDDLLGGLAGQVENEDSDDPDASDGGGEEGEDSGQKPTEPSNGLENLLGGLAGDDSEGSGR